MLPRDVHHLSANSAGVLLASDGDRRLAHLTGGWLVNVAVLPNEARISGITALPDDSFAISDSGLNRIWRLDSRFRLSPLAGVEQPPLLDRKPDRSDGPVDAARFRNPLAIATLQNGALAVAESDRDRTLIRFVFDGLVHSVEPTGLPPLRLSSFCPFNSDGIAAVTSPGPPVIFLLRRSKDGWALDDTIGSTTAAGTDDGNCEHARFVAPASLSATPDGFVLTDGTRIRRINRNLHVTTLAGSVPGYADGTGTAAQFGTLSALAWMDPDLCLVADRDNDALRSVTVDGVVSTVIGTLRDRRIALDEVASFSRAFGNAIVDDDVHEAWGIARVFLRDHRRSGNPWPDRSTQLTSVASARLGKALAETWSHTEDADRARVGSYCLWLIGCEERELGVNEIRDHRLRRLGEDLDPVAD